MLKDTFFEFNLTIKIEDKDVNEKGTKQTALHLENFLRDIRMWKRETEFEKFSISEFSIKDKKRKVIFQRKKNRY